MMKAGLNRIFSITSVVLLCAGCAGGATYSPPPERRASERCPVGETWVCKDRYPSRLGRERDVPMICYCESLQRMR